MSAGHKERNAPAAAQPRGRGRPQSDGPDAARPGPRHALRSAGYAGTLLADSKPGAQDLVSCKREDQDKDKRRLASEFRREALTKRSEHLEIERINSGHGDGESGSEIW